jgi:hypothetical protein
MAQANSMTTRPSNPIGFIRRSLDCERIQLKGGASR